MNQNSAPSQENQAAGEAASATPQIQHRWPSLGKELMVREQNLAESASPHQQIQALQEQYRQETLAHLYESEGQYSHATRYLAFLLVKYGRGADIVGNPVLQGAGRLSALPYTGLEGYYAGSVCTERYPGLSQDEVLHEEAALGLEMLHMLKKDAVARNAWADYLQIRHTLEGTTQTRGAIQTIQTLWMTLVAQLRSRVYHHPEFEPTLSERIEQSGQILRQIGTHTPDEPLLLQSLQEEQHRLQALYDGLNGAEKVQEQNERRRREAIRRARITAFQQFRERTYQILEESRQKRYAVAIEDRSWDKATLLETIILPHLQARETYPRVSVHWTPEEADGYLFLAQLGEIGADPLARSELVFKGTGK